MSHISAELLHLVIQRAVNRGEYCQLAQAGQEATFHVDHIVPQSAGGATKPENLALACVSCSLRKAARQTAPDPETGESVSLFHPRMDRWSDHFRWNGLALAGLTPTGRATIGALQMNRPLILAIRAEGLQISRHPQP